MDAHATGQSLRRVQRAYAQYICIMFKKTRKRVPLSITQRFIIYARVQDLRF